MFLEKRSSTLNKAMAMWTFIVLLLLTQCSRAYSQTNNNGDSINGQQYKGAFIGKFSSYAHQVAGDVYAIDEYTFLIKEFFFDGLASDAYFWVGATALPSNIGFIVPNEHGKTNKLRQYINQDIRIRLPEDKRIQSIKWISVWDIRAQKNFADLYIPEGFLPPSPQIIAEFSQLSNDVKSEPVVILDAKTIRIPEFTYDGKRKAAYFWVGMGPQPTSAGQRIPNELGYLEPLKSYKDDLVILELPGNMTIFDINYISVWDEEAEENLGSVILPQELNIPPTLTQVIKIESRLPNCEQLHQRLQVNWEIFGPQITFELIGQIEPDEYMAFGFSGSDNSSRMINSDVSISYLENHIGYTKDYNISGLFPCTNILGNYKGVCPDTKVGGVDNFQINLFERIDSLSRITFRRNLQNTGDDGDFVIDKSKEMFIVWSVGKLTNKREPGFHHLYPKNDISIMFGRKATKNCFQFTTPKFSGKKDLKDSSSTSSSSSSSNGPINVYQQTSSILTKPWGPLRLMNRSMTTFYARIGDSGGLRGYQGSTGNASPSLVWYINGLLAPILYVKRGRTYTFRIEGGNNPSIGGLYNPLYITTDPNGGFAELSDSERKRSAIYAGIEWDRRGRPSPTTAGRLCAWRAINSIGMANEDNSDKKYFDKRRADTNRYQNFIQYRNALDYQCEPGNAALLQWTPNASTPDIVYYQSYTHPNMGNKIIVLDDFISSYAFIGGGSASGGSITSNANNILSHLKKKIEDVQEKNVEEEEEEKMVMIVIMTMKGKIVNVLDHKALQEGLGDQDIEVEVEVEVEVHMRMMMMIELVYSKPSSRKKSRSNSPKNTFEKSKKNSKDGLPNDDKKIDKNNMKKDNSEKTKPVDQSLDVKKQSDIKKLTSKEKSSNNNNDNKPEKPQPSEKETEKNETKEKSIKDEKSDKKVTDEKDHENRKPEEKEPENKKSMKHNSEDKETK
ncbi:hypothetical protein BLOT_016681, partial [Blomia tropicalis]